MVSKNLWRLFKVEYFNPSGVNYYVSYETNRLTASPVNRDISGDIVIVGEFFGEKVTAISGFSNNLNITSLTVPDTIEYIDRDSFKGLNESVYNIYDNGRYIGTDDNPYFIFVEGLLNCETCLIHEDTELICVNAFGLNYDIKTVRFLGDKIKYVGYGMFDTASKLENVELPEHFPSIPFSMFRRCTSLKTIALPQGIESIGESSFSESGITAIDLPISLKTIGPGAFENCWGLKMIFIPKNVENIDPRAFINCLNLGRIDADNSNEHYTSSSGVLFNKNLTKLVKVPEETTSLIIPSSVNELGDYSMYSCEELTSIDIPDSVTTIGRAAISHCLRITEITIPDSVITLDDFALNYCLSLATLNLGGGIKTIGELCIASCRKLETINFNNYIDKFNEIKFGSNWNDEVNVHEVTCLDGTVNI